MFFIISKLENQKMNQKIKSSTAIVSGTKSPKELDIISRRFKKQKIELQKRVNIIESKLKENIFKVDKNNSFLKNLLRLIKKTSHTPVKINTSQVNLTSLVRRRKDLCMSL